VFPWPIYPCEGFESKLFGVRYTSCEPLSQNARNHREVVREQGILVAQGRGRGLYDQKLHEAPDFVQDVWRNILQNAKVATKDRNLGMHGATATLESIHKHDFYAQGSVVPNRN